MLYSTVCCAGTQVYNIIEAHAELDVIYRPKLAHIPTYLPVFLRYRLDYRHLAENSCVVSNVLDVRNRQCPKIFD